MDIHIREDLQEIYDVSCSSDFWPLQGDFEKNFDVDFM